MTQVPRATWDPLGQLGRTVGPDTTTGYTYDSAGRRTGRSDGTTATTYAWGLDGRLAGQTHTHTPTATTIATETRRYDANLHLTEIQYEKATTEEGVELTWDPTMSVPQISNWQHTDAAGTTELSFNQDSTGAPNTSDHTHAFDRYGSAIDIADPANYSVTAAGRFDEYGNPLEEDREPLSLEDTQHSFLGYRNEPLLTPSFEGYAHLSGANIIGMDSGWYGESRF